jgi:dTDP-4-amino-4,6-dideoxygalactose transaminase
MKTAVPSNVKCDANTDNIMVTRPLMPEIEAYKGRMREIWDSQWVSNIGPFHRKLEKELVDYLSVPFLSLFNNGTIALLTAIQSLRLQGEVITTPFTFPATTHVLEWNKITPVFCDIDPQTMTIDPDRIEHLITAKTTAILGVHVYGIPCHVKEIQEIADRHGLKVVYDAAHAFSTQIDGVPIGRFGDVSMFSFHPTKLFHTGEGGALSYNDPNMKDRIELLKNFGIKNQEEVILPGINGKMSELSAAMGLEVLPLVEQEKEKRRKIRQIYNEMLSDVKGISLVNVAENINHSEQYYVIRVNAKEFGKSRDEIHEILKARNIFTRKYFYPLISDYPCYASLPSARGEYLPEATKASHEVLCLPFYGELKPEVTKKICEMIMQVKLQS